MENQSQYVSNAEAAGFYVNYEEESSRCYWGRQDR